MKVLLLVIFVIILIGLFKKFGRSFKENVIIRQQLGDEKVDWVLKQGGMK